MNWVDIASIVFVCVTANHLGLIRAITDVSKMEIPIVGCPKCLTFWCSLAYMLWSVGFSDIPQMLAISFLASYTAVWLELLEGFIDYLYIKVYEQIYPTADTTDTDT